MIIKKLKAFLKRIITQGSLSKAQDPFLYLKRKGLVPKNLLAKKGDTIVHLGVWRIETITQWSQIVGSDGKVIIVEADDVNHMINQVEVKRRLLNNVILVHKGAWYKKEKITLQVSEISKRNKVKETDSMDRLNPDSNYSEEKIIDGDTLDNILDQLDISKIDHVFMTISGAELEALQGMQKTIEKNRNLSLYIRSTLLNRQGQKSNNEVVVNYLTKLGFLAMAAPKEVNRDGSNVYAVKKAEAAGNRR